MPRRYAVQRSRSWKDAAIVIGLLLFIFGVLWADPRSHNNPDLWRQAGLSVLAVLVGVPLLMWAMVAGLVGMINLGRSSRRLKYPLQEAREWLSQRLPERSFAGNRFDDLVQAKEFVDRLYRMGAVKVEVDNIGSRAKTETRTTDGKSRVVAVEGSRLYADTLRVTLPSRSDQRKAIFELYNQESEEDRLQDAGEKFLEFWWD